MVQQFIHHPDDYRQWEAWDSLSIPVLCLRGEESDLVLRDTTAEMLVADINGIDCRRTSLKQHLCEATR